MYANRVQGFQTIRPYHHEWMQGANKRNLYIWGYNSFNLQTVIDSQRKNVSLDDRLLENSFNQIPILYVNGTNYQVTTWSVAKHAHHGPNFGLDPSKYGISQSDLDNIAMKSLINRINQGWMAPTPEYVKSLQMKWKLFAKHKNVTRFDNRIVMGRNCIVLKHIKSGLFISFETLTGQSFRG